MIHNDRISVIVYLATAKTVGKCDRFLQSIKLYTCTKKSNENRTGRLFIEI